MSDIPKNDNEQLAISNHPGITAMAGKGVRIPGDVVNKATADLADNQRSAIRRLHAFYAENDLSLGETGKLIGKSDSVISLIFRGKYEANLDDVVREIDRFFDLYEKRNEGRKLDFIKTELTEKIWKVCDAARQFQRIAFVFGDTQIGKTTALKAYRDEHNHGSTIYTSIPTGGALMNYLPLLARKLRISENLTIHKLRERIISAFDDRMLLIADEAHRCIRESGNPANPIQTIEFIREIFDETGCGVVISATNVFRDAMDNGPVERILRQTKRRRLCALQLPNLPSAVDLNAFAAGYKLDPPTGKAKELQTAMVDAEALGMWLILLRMGALLASQRKATMTWDHVLQANAGLKKLEGKKF